MTDLDPLDIQSQEEATTSLKEKQANIQRLEAEDFKWLMSDKRGRRVVWRLLEKTGVFRNPFTGSSETFFRCGEMNIGQRYVAMIHEHCPERYNLMVMEQQDNGKRTDNRNRRNTH